MIRTVGSPSLERLGSLLGLPGGKMPAASGTQALWSLEDISERGLEGGGRYNGRDMRCGPLRLRGVDCIGLGKPPELTK
jgi:hypothetical protein